jgi:Cdc6-like AAA superfamily ATPase
VLFEMRLVKQRHTLPVVNLDFNRDKQFTRHGDLLPSTIRCIIAGPSGVGKTVLVLSLLFAENGLSFENVYVYSKSLYQTKYQILEKIIKSVKGVNYFSFKENDEILDPSEAKNESIFIFDDVVCDKQHKIQSFFCMGRHKNIDTFYLVQSYVKAKKSLIRDNCNFIVLFKQDDINLKHVYEEHVGTDMTFEQFKLMCGLCWENKFDFLVINKDCDLNSGRYRKSFDQYICI